MCEFYCFTCAWWRPGRPALVVITGRAFGACRWRWGPCSESKFCCVSDLSDVTTALPSCPLSLPAHPHTHQPTLNASLVSPHTQHRFGCAPRHARPSDKRDEMAASSLRMSPPVPPPPPPLHRRPPLPPRFFVSLPTTSSVCLCITIASPSPAPTSP
jgi:hypothetical protein